MVKVLNFFDFYRNLELFMISKKFSSYSRRIFYRASHYSYISTARSPCSRPLFPVFFFRCKSVDSYKLSQLEYDHQKKPRVSLLRRTYNLRRPSVSLQRARLESEPCSRIALATACGECGYFFKIFPQERHEAPAEHERSIDCGSALFSSTGRSTFNIKDRQLYVTFDKEIPRGSFDVCIFFASSFMHRIATRVMSRRTF